MSKNKYFYPILASIIGLVVALRVVGPDLFDDTVVQDDFRQSMFWVWRFWDPSLFPKDFLADLYSDSFDKLPLLFVIYKLAPLFTDNLIFFSKLLAIVIATITCLIGYLFFEKFSGNKFYSIAFTTALAITLWCTDHVSVGHARSFIWFFVFCYMFLKYLGKSYLANLTIFISLLMSPIAFLLTIVMEAFDLLINSRTELFNIKSPQVQGLIFNLVSVLILYKFLNPHSSLLPFPDGQAYSLEEMKTLAEFNPGGRHPIFGTSINDGSWWMNEHWGMGIGFLAISKILPLAAIILCLNTFLIRDLKQFLKTLKSNPAILVYSSIFLYLFAQVSFPMIYMPSRYIGISSIIISLVIIFKGLPDLFEGFLKVFLPKLKSIQVITFVLLGLFTFVYGIYFSEPTHMFTRYVKMDKNSKQFFCKLPKDSVVASHPLLPDINMLSAICKRSIFMSYEHSRPYFSNRKIMEEVRRRNIESFKMTYAQSAKELLELMESNKVSHVIAFAGFYSPNYLARPVYNEPYNGLLRQLTQKRNFYLAEFLKSSRTNYAVISKDLLLTEVQKKYNLK